MTELAFLPAHEALPLLHSGALSAREMVAASLAQIDRHDPLLHAFVSVRHDDVLREAAAIDERHARGERLPLHGLPLALKDNMETAGIRTTHGSTEFKDHVPQHDSSYVARLKRAGALIVGKASLPEFAAYMNTRNALVGVTRNPWNTENSSGGSSGGTAVALATGMATIGMGTDYGGSVRLPAAFNAITGLRGTPGLITTFPSNWPFDTFAVAGPMCRNVADLDLMLRVLTGPVAHSPMTPMPAYMGPDAVAPESLRIAWSEDLDNLFPVDQAVRDVLRRARPSIAGLGVRITDAAPPMHGIRDSVIPLRDVRTLILHSGRLERIHQMGNELLVASIERAKKTTALDVAKAEIARSRVAAACAGFFDDFDILAMPATQMVSFRADQAAPTEIEGRKIPEALDTCLSTYAITMLGWPCLVIRRAAGRSATRRAARQGGPTDCVRAVPRARARLVQSHSAARPRRSGVAASSQTGPCKGHVNEGDSAMPNPLVYMVRADLVEDFIEEHHKWYERRHAPDVLAAGFWSARGYDSPVTPHMWNIYEVPNVALFSSEAYTGSHKNDPFVAVAVTKLIGRTVSVYTQVLATSADGAALARIPTVRGPGLTSLRFDTTADGAMAEAWFRAQVVKAHAGVAGVRTIRLWEQREAHPKWASAEPRWSVGVEWESAAAIEAANGKGKLQAAAADASIKATNVKVDAVVKRYGLMREDLFEG